LKGLIPNWQNHLGLFLALTEASKIPAGDVYETVGLPRFKKHRCPKATVVVKAFMSDLGWYYRDNGTQPYFAERKKPQRLTILKRVSNETGIRQTKD
jgi:hypothetical protein